MCQRTLKRICNEKNPRPYDEHYQSVDTVKYCSSPSLITFLFSTIVRKTLLITSLSFSKHNDIRSLCKGVTMFSLFFLIF